MTIPQRPTHISAVATVLLVIKTFIQREREREREPERRTETDRHRQADIDRDRDRERRPVPTHHLFNLVQQDDPRSGKRR